MIIGGALFLEKLPVFLADHPGVRNGLTCPHDYELFDRYNGLWNLEYPYNRSSFSDRRGKDHHQNADNLDLIVLPCLLSGS